VLGDLAVDAGQRDRVEDLPGAPHDRRDHRRAEVAGQEPGRHFREPIAQRHRQPDLPQRPAMTDRQRTRHLRRGGVEVITGPPRVLALAAAAAFQLGDRRQLAGLSGRRSPPSRRSPRSTPPHPRQPARPDEQANHRTHIRLLGVGAT